MLSGMDVPIRQPVGPLLGCLAPTQLSWGLELPCLVMQQG
jgi:hypothetical protein